MSDAASRWRIVSPATLSWREWDGEFVVRDERRGGTHLLSLNSGRIFSMLLGANTAASAFDLALRLMNDATPDDASQLAGEIEVVLIEFERIGLAEREIR